jgi:hypothetical protein
MKAKKLLKQISALALIGIMSATQLTTAFCEGAAAVSVNGENIDFGTSEPIIIDGTTYVPIRAVFEKFGNGTTVDWDNDKKAVTITYKGDKLVLYTLTGEVTYKGETTTLANIPVIKDGRTLLPLRELVEMLGGSLTWFADTKSIEVYENLGTTSKDASTLLSDFKGMPLPQALYVLSENEKKYDGIGFDDICEVADTTGYDELATAAKEVAKIDADEYMDTDENLPVYGKFAEEYFNAIIALKDKSFLTGTAKQAFNNNLFTADNGVSVKDSVEKIYNGDFTKNIRINPETIIFAGITYADLDFATIKTNNFNEALMYVYIKYMDVAHKDIWDAWDSLVDKTLAKNKETAKQAVSALKDVPLPQALYMYFNDDSFYSDDIPGELEILETIVKNADCREYADLKEYTEKAIEDGKNDDYSDDAIMNFALFEMYYFESLSLMSDKSFMSDVYLKLFDNKDVKYASDTTTLDSVNSLNAYLHGKEKTVKVNKAYEALAKALIFMVKEGNTTYQTDDFKSAASLANTYIKFGMIVFEDFAKEFEKAGMHYKDISDMTEEELKDFFGNMDSEQSNA